VSKFDFLKDAKSERSAPAAYPATQVPEAPGTRVRGKRSDKENFVQVSAYLRRDTNKALRVALAEEGREFSDLVEEWAAAWLRTRVPA
jgi:hypothetical protein